jgi:hypothetical protein
MARARVPTERELAAFLIGHGIVDFVSGGRITRAERNVLWKALKKLGPPAARGVAGFIPQAARTIGTVAMKHPYVAAGAVIYVGIKEREKIRALLEQGYDIVEERFDRPSPMEPTGRPTLPGLAEPISVRGMAARPFSPSISQAVTPETIFGIPAPRRKRKKSSYNKAVSAGMKAIKNSTSFGKKGVIKPATSAFKTVVSVGKAIKAKRKKPKKGIRSKVYTAMKRFYR